ncbi:hypothetical protein ACS0TY_000198 [Phlomoides rotata]
MPLFNDAIINDVLDKLTGQRSGLQIIPIVGMGGIGKTTFARNIYAKPLIDQYFDIRAWVTISQEFSRGKFLQVLCQEVKGSIIDLSQMSEDEIGLSLYQHLWGRRYLIVMDDIWSVEAWDKVESFFPKENNGSRIVITTRLSNLAIQLSGSHDFHMQFLDEDKSWHLLCEIVFGKPDCPIELEYIGKKIATKCKGLPLSIVVIGGILRPMYDKSLEEVAKEYLKELIERNLILISELRWNGEARLCKMHDLLRDICLREAQKQKLFCVVRQQKHNTPQGIDMERRICIHPENAKDKYSPEFFHAVEAASLTRSLLYTMLHRDKRDASPSLRFRLLRTLKVYCHNSLKLTFEIWKMPLLRHVSLDGFALPDPSNGEDNFVLENLQTLSDIRNLKFSEEVVKRIPNIKKLKLTYERAGLDEEVLPEYYLINLGRLQKLESLSLREKFRSNLELVRGWQEISKGSTGFPRAARVGTRLAKGWQKVGI